MLKNSIEKNLILGLDRVSSFVMLIIVNPTAFPRFGERRQFFYEPR